MPMINSVKIASGNTLLYLANKSNTIILENGVVVYKA